MLTILEIILTVIAWKRGWKRWAILPLILAIFTGVMLGFIEISSGPNSAPPDNGFWLTLGDSTITYYDMNIFSFGAIIALVVMVCKPRKSTGKIPGNVQSAGEVISGSPNTIISPAGSSLSDTQQPTDLSDNKQREPQV